MTLSMQVLKFLARKLGMTRQAWERRGARGPRRQISRICAKNRTSRPRSESPCTLRANCLLALHSIQQLPRAITGAVACSRVFQVPGEFELCGWLFDRARKSERHSAKPTKFSPVLSVRARASVESNTMQVACALREI